MAEAEGGGNIEAHHISIHISNFPGNFVIKEEQIEVTEEEIELNLGLSLNGRFGVDPSSKRLKRCSSIPEFMNPVKKEQDSAACVVPTMMWTSMPLSRTCSLPVETEGEWTKRKELQTLRRMAAKRKRKEKRRNLRPMNDHDPATLGDNCDEDKRIEDKRLMPIEKNQQYMKVSPPPLTARGRRFGACQIESKCERSNGLVGGGGGMDEMPAEGMNKCTESKSPANTRTLPEQGDQEPAFNPAKPENPSNNSPNADKEAEEMARNVMLGMPCVYTKGDGPIGKRIQGLLYPCKKGEVVKIVCVCHGSFLSPAEFVKHAGGGEVANPLTHIIVNPSSFL